MLIERPAFSFIFSVSPDTIIYYITFLLNNPLFFLQVVQLLGRQKYWSSPPMWVVVFQTKDFGKMPKVCSDLPFSVWNNQFRFCRGTNNNSPNFRQTVRRCCRRAIRFEPLHRVEDKSPCPPSSKNSICEPLPFWMLILLKKA